jgi:hypothetical protein
MRSYTVKVLCLLALLLIRSNAYAYCYATDWAWYGPVYSSLGVAQGTTMQSCQQLACQLFPNIPECGQPPEPPCQDIVEFQSLACEPNYSGAINQTRTKTCSNNQWTDWTTTSNNCSPNPPTCQTSVEERQVACSEGYTGSITEQRQSQCPDPYGQPIFGAWAETQRSCQMTTNNPMNVNSPVSPISPVNQMDVPVPTPMEVPLVAPVEMQMQMTVETPKVETQKSSGSESTSSSPTASSSTETKETPQKIEVPKGKDLVPGFGLVMSLELLNKPMEFQQQQLQNNLDYTQELSNEFRGNTDFLLQLLTDNDVGDSFRGRNDWLWGNLRRHNDLQPCYSCD